MVALSDAGARLGPVGRWILVKDRHLVEVFGKRGRSRKTGHAASGHERGLADLRHPGSLQRESFAARHVCKSWRNLATWNNDLK
jgi:hypothetical protein